MADNCHVLLFGDSALSAHHSLLKLYRVSKRSQILSLFLRASLESLQNAVAHLPLPERSYFGSHDFLELSEVHERDGCRNPAVALVLSCLNQFGWMLVQAEEDSEMFRATGRRVFVGLCYGLLPAVTIGVSRSIAELLEIAPQVICISLRLGFAIARRASAIEQTLESWSIVISGLKEDEAQTVLRDFEHRQKLPSHRRAYISAIYPKSTTLSGPPSTLQALFASTSRLCSARTMPVPCAMALHAAHLEVDCIPTILGSSSILGKALPNNAIAISPSSGRPLSDDRSLKGLLTASIVEILQKPLRWSAFADYLASDTAEEIVKLSIVGFASASSLLEKKLKPAAIQRRADADPLEGPQLQNPSITDDIAIIGMSGRFPGAETLDEFWNILESGLDLHKKVPCDRFDVHTHCDPTGKIPNTTLTPYGCWMDRPGIFDRTMFKMAPQEVAQTDPMQRLQLLTAYEALEMAGYSYDRTSATHHSRIGTFTAQTSDDWRQINSAQDIGTYQLSGNFRAFGPGRINYHFGWEGPGVSIDTACSGSATALELACNALHSGQCSTALVGGASVLTASDPFAALSRAGFLSLNGPCKTWDEHADGYCRADAVATMVIKRLSDALTDNDNILAIIKAVVSNSAADAVSMVRPHAETQRRLFSRALHSANLRPNDLDFVELHGTGTQAGDLAETTAVRDVFARDRATLPQHPLYLGAIKSNLGHSESAAGITSMMKAILMCRHNTIPRHIGIKTKVNPKLPIASSDNIVIPLVNTPFIPTFNSDGRKRRILVNNFNASGGNVSTILEEPPVRGLKVKDPRTWHVIPISAATAFSLKENIRRLIKFLETRLETKLSDMAYTTSARRMHHNVRKAFVVNSNQMLLKKLSDYMISSECVQRIPKPPSVMFVFTGQGSLSPGVGKHLFESYEVFRDSIVSSDTICQNLGLPSILGVLNDAENKMDTVGESQLALVAFELALSTLWKSWGVGPTVVLGHSLGGYASLCDAGILSVTDMFLCVGQRAALMEKKCEIGTHSMLAVRLPATSIEEIIEETQLEMCEIACYNGPRSTIVSGSNAAIEQLQHQLGEKGISASLLNVPYAFHSAQIDAVIEDYEHVAKQVVFADYKIPVASSFLGKLVNDPSVFNAHDLVRQTREPVKFLQAIQDCQLQGALDGKTIYIEIGPRPICLPMIKSSLNVPSEYLLSSVAPGHDHEVMMAESLAQAYQHGLNIQWNQYHREYESALSLLELPSYAFDVKNYWIPYEGDWAIRKGRAAPATSASSPSSFLSTTTLQRLEGEDISETHGYAIFHSSLKEPNIQAVALGHVINDCALAPLSLYIDMVTTAASYLWSRMQPTESAPLIEVSSLSITKPLIVVTDDMNPEIRLTITTNVSLGTTAVFSTVDHTGIIEVARCRIIYGEESELIPSLVEQGVNCQSNIKRLQATSTGGAVERILHDNAYRLFSNVVRYGERYQGMQEVILDAKQLEAVANLNLQPSTTDESSVNNPYWIDILGQISGLLLNTTKAASGVTYICNELKSIRVFTKLSANQSYQSYVQMRPSKTNRTVVGDICVVDGQSVVAMFKEIKFQAIAKDMLDLVLSGKSESPEELDNEPQVKAKKSTVKNELLTPPPSSTPSSPTSHPDSAWVSALSYIADALGVSIDELGDDLDVSDAGMDSMVSIAITRKLKRDLGIDIPIHIFASASTFRDIRQFFDRSQPTTGGSGTPMSVVSTDSHVDTSSSNSPTSSNSASPPPEVVSDVGKKHGLSCPSVLLQGPAKPSATTMFLLPDGSGSSSSYASIPVLDSGLTVIGFDSPLLFCEDDQGLSLEAIARIYATTIQAEYPDVACILGGWSIGGVFAFEIAKQLSAEGRDIRCLLLLDAPCPGITPPMSTKTIQLLKRHSILRLPKRRQGDVGDDVLQHFRRSASLLETYKPAPWPSHKIMPSTVLIRARRSVLASLSEAKRAEVEFDLASDGSVRFDWLLAERDKNGADGWERLLPELRCEGIDADHFGMMTLPQVKTLGKLLQEAIKSIKS